MNFGLFGTYCAGQEESVLIIGSAAVELPAWYLRSILYGILRHIAWLAFIGYFCRYFSLILLNENPNIGIDPKAY